MIFSKIDIEVPIESSEKFKIIYHKYVIVAHYDIFRGKEKIELKQIGDHEYAFVKIPHKQCYTVIPVTEKMLHLEWEIKMYDKLMKTCKREIQSYFKVCRESAQGDLKELRRYIYAKNYVHSNSEDTSEWD